MRIVDASAIAAALDEPRIVAAVEQAFRDSAAGRVHALPVGQMRFEAPTGELHVKGAHLAGSHQIAIKVASSFYDNPARGLPSSGGVVALFDRATGRPVAVLQDEGMLTDLRTAIAGSIAARLIAPPGATTLGIVGSGTQAALQARWIARRTGIRRIMLWGRDPAKAAQLARELAPVAEVAIADDVASVCAQADVVVTTTPAAEPLLTADMARPGLRIVAVGADAPGKRELAPALLARAALLLVDSRAQCLAYGECAGGAAAGVPMLEIGAALAPGGMPALPADAIAIADLTGLGAQDAAIAGAVWERIGDRG